MKQESVQKSQCKPCSPEPRWRETEVEKGVGKDIEERLAWRNKTPFSPPTPWPSHVTSWANKCSIQPGSQGKWLLDWVLPNESRDAGYYYCFHHPCSSHDVGQISAGLFFLKDTTKKGKFHLYTVCSLHSFDWTEILTLIAHSQWWLQADRVGEDVSICLWVTSLP